jgi:hypothetical protein
VLNVCASNWVECFDVLTNSVEELVIAPCKVLEHHAVPFSQRTGDFVNDGLHLSGGCIIT